MVTISLCMIVKDEEAVLERCLKSICDAVEEIIIVDTGSTDKTKEIAARFTDKVFDFKWINDFSAARNFAYSKAGMDYQMWLDADDVLPESEKQKLIELKNSLTTATDMVAMKYITSFDENDKPIFTSTRERLTLREKQYKWEEPVHECIAMSGNIVYSDITIHHKKPDYGQALGRNLDIYESIESSGAELSARGMYYYARELMDHANYAKAVYYFERFLHEKKGWYEDNIACCLSLSICYQRLNDNDKILPVLIKSFEYDSPRPETCCEIAYRYMSEENYVLALKWFDLAANLPDSHSAGFVMEGYRGFIPNIEACVCSSNLGDYKKAWEYNERAAKFNPKHPSIASNRKFIQGMLDSQQ